MRLLRSKQEFAVPATDGCSKSRLLLAAMWLGSWSALHCEAKAEHWGQAVSAIGAADASLGPVCVDLAWL